MLVSSCYVSRGMTVKRVSISKSDLQYHPRALAVVPSDRPRSTYDFLLVLHCNYVSLSCTVKEILSLISQKLKRPRDSEHILLRTIKYIMHALVLLCINQQTKFEVPSPIPKINLKKLNGYRDPDHAN